MGPTDPAPREHWFHTMLAALVGINKPVFLVTSALYERVWSTLPRLPSAGEYQCDNNGEMQGSGPGLRITKCPGIYAE
jgi:hypothetical protein